MTKKMTIQLAVEEFDLYDLYKEIIESYGDDLEDPSLASDFYDLIDESEEEFEFWPDSDGDVSESFERNLREAITTIVEANDDLVFVDDDFLDDENISEMYDDEYEKGGDELGLSYDEVEDQDDF